MRSVDREKDMRRILALVLALAGASPALAAGSTYTSVNDRKLCTYKETKASANNPESCEFLCQGPTAGVRTKLLSCHDYEHLFIDNKCGSRKNVVRHDRLNIFHLFNGSLNTFSSNYSVYRISKLITARTATTKNFYLFHY